MRYLKMFKKSGFASSSKFIDAVERIYKQEEKDIERFLNFTESYISNNIKISKIEPYDNDSIIDILSVVFKIVDDKETIRNRISKRLNNNLSVKIEIDGKIVGCYLLAEKSINEFISDINDDKLKDFPKKSTKILIDSDFSDNGLQGISLAILPEFRGFNLGSKLKEYTYNLGYDYIWGVQDKKLENIEFWKRTRDIIAESPNAYASISR